MKKAAIRAWVVWGCLLGVASGLAASEYHGTIQSRGLPVPGATVTATQGEKKAVTTTDAQGVFQFADLADGVWTIDVEMLGFARLTRQVGVARVAPVPRWELQLLSQEELMANLAPAGEPGAAPLQAKGAPPAGERNPQAQGRPANGRGMPARNGFERLNVNPSTDTASSGTEGEIRSDEIAGLSQTAANSFIVQGSMSSALGMAPHGDWRFGAPGMGMDPMMLGLGVPIGGPAGPAMGGPGMGGPAGDGPAPQSGGPRMAVGGSGGPGGPPGGMGPGGPGGMGPGGGPGGGSGGPGGFGGPGGPGGFGPRDRQGWQGRPNSMAFGNARRDPRTSYNGNVFLGFNNSFWDARTFSVTGADVQKPAYADFRGGFMFGGPLRIPKLVSAERRIFFALNLQLERSRTGTVSQPVNMPTAPERSGDFSGASVTIYDPSSGLPFSGNHIPASRIEPAAAALLKYFPNPNLPFAARNYQTAWTGTNNSSNLNARVSNVRIGGKDRLDGGVGYQSRNSTTPNLFQFIDTSAGRGINASLGWSHNLTAHWINNLRYTFSRNREQASPYFAGRQNVAAELGIAGTSQDPMNWGPPT